MHPELVSTTMRVRLGSYDAVVDVAEVGQVISIGDGIARVSGVESVFSQFGSDLDKATRAQLDRGERLIEVLKQRQYEPLSIEKQVVILYAGTRGHLDRYAVADVCSYESELVAFLETRHPAILATIADRKRIDEQLATALNDALEEFVTRSRTPGFAAAA